MGSLSRSRAPIRPQSGDVLLYVLFALLVLLLGALFTMRGLSSDSFMEGNTLQRQKNVQAGDAALLLAVQTILNTVQVAGNVPLEIAAVGQPWFFVPPGPGAWAPPAMTGGSNVGYWSVCAAGTAQPCASFAGAAGGYSGKWVVVPTNLPVDPYICGTTGYTAVYYDIFLHTVEANGSTAADTETVFKLCTP